MISSFIAYKAFALLKEDYEVPKNKLEEKLLICQKMVTFEVESGIMDERYGYKEANVFCREIVCCYLLQNNLELPPLPPRTNCQPEIKTKNAS